MSKRSPRLAYWVVTICCFIAASSMPIFSVRAQAPTGTIAYVRAGHQSGDQIRLIEPDGSGDRALWTVPVEDPNNIFEILSLAWRPDATELAFSSDHEHACSIFASDLYTVRPTGTHFRRVSNGPACDELASLPQGGVTVTVRNSTFKFDTTFFVYVQGAPGIRQITISQGQTATVVFPEVADFGAVEQQVVVMQANERWEVAQVDVQPGEMVTALPNPAPILSDGIPDYGAWGPTWRSDGSRIGFARSSTSCMSGYAVQADNPPLGTKGEPVVSSDATIAPCSIAWAPTAAKAAQLLFLAFPNFGLDGATFYLATEGTNGSAGEKLFSLGTGVQLLWYDWAPDGQSMLFVQTTKFANISYVEANLFEYDFASGDITQITNLVDEFVRSFSVSPDGQQIVFERAPTMDSPDSDLWLIDRDGSNLTLLVEDGRIPNWGTKKPSGPPINPPASKKLFLPGLGR